MRKYWLIFSAFITLSFLMGLGSASASTNPFPPQPAEDSPYMTLNSDTSERTSFGWSEQPFSYLSFDNTLAPGALLNINRIWRYGSDTVATQFETYSGGSSFLQWKGLDNWFDSGVRKTGAWSVETVWGYDISKYTASSTSHFTVTPEPVSAILFAIGGLALTGRKFFRSKQVQV